MTRDDQSGRGATRRRLRFGVMSATLVAVVTAACVVAGVVAHRVAGRYDVTATREHSLAQRTRDALKSMEKPVEIVVVAEERALDPRARRRMADVLDAFGSASPSVTVTKIDPTTDYGRSRFEALRGRVAAMYEADTRARVEEAIAAREAAGRAAGALTAVSDDLVGIDAGDAPGVDLSRAAAVARLAAQRLGDAVGAVASITRESEIAEIEAARGALTTALVAARDDAAALVRALGAANVSDAARDAVRRAVRSAESARDAAAAAADSLERRPPSQAFMALRILESTDAVLVLSEGVSTAIAFESLFPAAARIDDAGGSAAELRFVGEELIATAIASLAMPRTPMVVITHTLPGRLLTSAGEPASQQAREVVGALVSRLALRGVTLAEWPVALEPSRPASAVRARADGRPVVWFCFGTEGASAEAANRFDAYARAVSALIADGGSLVVSVAPSARPASGADDPLAAALRATGILADTGRAIVRRSRLGSGDVFDLSYVFRGADRSSAIGSAIDGLPLALTWMTPIAPAEGASGAAFLEVPADGATWAEAEWRAFAAAPDDRPWGTATPPTPNARFDSVEGPWSVAAAVEIAGSMSGQRRRVVAIASPGWFFDRLADRRVQVDGRQVAAHPGNLELAEAAIFWAAGLDELIATSAIARDTPRIAAIADDALAMIRWALILGLPTGVLLLGAMMRITVFR